jgi:hypothetical protein
MRRRLAAERHALASVARRNAAANNIATADDAGELQVDVPVQIACCRLPWDVIAAVHWRRARTVTPILPRS